METTKHKNSFLDFWKIPTNIVSFCESREETTKGGFLVFMPPQDLQTKATLVRWKNAHLSVPITDSNLKTDDISVAITSDPSSGIIKLPFNFDQAITNLLTEKYLENDYNHSLYLLSRIFYFKLKPLLSRFIQIWIRKRAVKYMSLREFPSWELDTSVDLMQRYLMAKLLEIRRDPTLPIISFWPQGAEICFLLSHDVETYSGIQNIPKIINIEKKYGFRSVWNFIPERYPLDLSIIRELQDSGFEIGVHGLYHDGKLFDSLTVFQQRATKINQYIRQWESAGFRSPSNIRNIDWISKYIQTEYDSSYVSSEWYGAQPGGCCTVFPFLYNHIVELPTTLQQDFTLLEILNQTPEETLKHWIKTVQKIKTVNGLVQINIHPDYLTTPDRLILYENFLAYMKSELNCWHALPRDVARWWRDRNNSELVLAGTKLYVDGPARDRAKVMSIRLHEGDLVITPDRLGINIRD